MAAAGPLSTVIDLAWLKGHRPDANALVVLNRVAFFDGHKRELADAGRQALLRWAVRDRLGQTDDLIAGAWRRREAALRTMRQPFVRLLARPEWRLVVGLGNKANAHEIGLAMHGTYGWPVIPGSGLKGLAHAWASLEASGASEADVQRVLGTAGKRGSVCFLDAIPAGEPAAVEADVLTPHVKPYYDDVAAGQPPDRIRPPAEYHNPVPVQFLTVNGVFAVDLYGTDRRDVGMAAEWLRKAGSELGAGAKTSAGYGYLEIGPA